MCSHFVALFSWPGNPVVTLCVWMVFLKQRSRRGREGGRKQGRKELLQICKSRQLIFQWELVKFLHQVIEEICMIYCQTFYVRQLKLFGKAGYLKQNWKADQSRELSHLADVCKKSLQARMIFFFFFPPNYICFSKINSSPLRNMWFEFHCSHCECL